VSERRARGTTVWMPVELKARVESLSRKYGKPQWRILMEAVALYETTLRKYAALQELPSVDKALWYMEKLAMSIGALKENPGDDNLAKTAKTISQVRERLQVDTSLLEKAVADYVKVVKDSRAGSKARDEATIELNMALKFTLVEITYKHILKEAGSPPAAPPVK